METSAPGLDPAALDPKTANILYHDKAAAGYDEKWSIQFDEHTLAYVEERVAKVVADKRKFGRALELGSGTGFFLLHLYKGGWVEEGAATDISPKILEVCARNADEIGWTVETHVADAEKLPFPDDSFDLVCGHAFLHHIPDVAQCVREMVRVAKPGGTVLVAGEPTRDGHRIAQAAKWATRTPLKAALRIPGLKRFAKPARTPEEDELARLEPHVDLWEFDPVHLSGVFEGAGLVDVRFECEELTSSVFGWTLKTIEGILSSDLFGARWAWFGYNNYLRLSALDERFLYKVLPKRWFYNVVMAGEKPLP
ncbi:MAG: class I SAM-dependent methyltransferase [Acidimicrobiia bacterium]|nr:class I SAM-dependent methyltransferase [Acidimicrobiia bacterium]